MMNQNYRLAKDNGFALVQFGPCMTQAKALIYQADLDLAGFPTVVVNTKAEPVPVRPNRKDKGKAKFISWVKTIPLSV